MAPSGCRDEWLVRALEKRGLVNPALAEEARAYPSASAELLRRGALRAEQLSELLWEQYRLRFADPPAGAVDKLACSLVPESLCRKRTLVPLRLDGDAIEILTSDPLDVAVLDEVMAASGRRPRAVFGLAGHIVDLINELYSGDKAIYDLLRKFPDSLPVEFADGEAPDDKDTVAGSAGAPVTRLANQIIAQAVRLGASDIHIEQEEHSTVARYRIDGVLRTIMTLPKRIGDGPLISRVKIMSNLDVADRRRPQDGRAQIKVGGHALDLRVSIMPTAFGEKAVLRILDQRQTRASLDSLGFRPEIEDAITSLSAAEQGLLLLTGPTGSGKTTTLYSIINRLRTDGVNIVTIEDPIEYRLPGITQIQVNEKTGLSFASVLRSVLRQDPDIILVGEIRDRETADIVFQAAMTGHLVLSTLHTNDAASTVNRLLDMGIERYKIAPALLGVVSQRLVRRFCPDCAGKGCHACAATGLRGRLALAEVLDLRSPQARARLGSAASLEGFEAAAVEKGWLKLLSDDAAWHLREGKTTREEVAPYLAAAFIPTPVILPPAAPAARADLGQEGRRRVLIVDDNLDNRALARAALRAEGYEFEEAADGQAALDAVRRGAPDLVLLDLMMPGVDGFSVIKSLRSEASTAGLPVIVLTAMSEAESQAASLEMGADDYMTKPFHPKILRARVAALFRRQAY
jgi:type IV pilus assembly protein PilB